jgi:hypothetical protein
VHGAAARFGLLDRSVESVDVGHDARLVVVGLGRSVEAEVDEEADAGVG